MQLYTFGTDRVDLRGQGLTGSGLQDRIGSGNERLFGYSGTGSEKIHQSLLVFTHPVTLKAWSNMLFNGFLSYFWQISKFCLFAISWRFCLCYFFTFFPTMRKF